MWKERHAYFDGSYHRGRGMDRGTKRARLNRRGTYPTVEDWDTERDRFIGAKRNPVDRRTTVEICTCFGKVEYPEPSEGG